MIICQRIRVISSPSISTIGVVILILSILYPPEFSHYFIVYDELGFRTRENCVSSACKLCIIRLQNHVLSAG